MSNNLELAITKIGDLLLDGKITKNQDDKEIKDVNLTIPDYQRPYKWTAKNANQLLDDIIEAQTTNKEVYRVGTLILHKDTDKDTSETVYEIVDGQQRIITFSLLLLCFEKENISFLNQKLYDNYFNITNIQNNFRALKRRIDSLEKEHDDLRDYIKNNCELIVVITNSLSEAFQFFDSQNARGKKLYPHDLLKAYHLREINNMDAVALERLVKEWEDLDQKKLSLLFSDYLYRLKEWVKGNKSYELNEHNIDQFKGVSSRDNYSYAQFYKGAYCYADDVNNSHLPFVTGAHKLNPFQIDSPIIAGRPFFEYSKHYFDILADIQNNDKYEGCFVNDNEIIKTLNLKKYRNGVGNRITRLLLDTSILLYVDRFCSSNPSSAEIKLLDQFIIYAFVWAYSMRAQYTNVGWLVAQNYIMGYKEDSLKNSFNIFKTISEANSPIVLLSNLAEKVEPLAQKNISGNAWSDYKDCMDRAEKEHDNSIKKESYIFYFEEHNFLIKTE